MEGDNLRQAIARQESLRRARDRAWMVFAGFLAAAVFLWATVVAAVRAAPGEWPPALIVYAVLALVATVIAWKLFGSATALNRRLHEGHRPGGAPEEPKD